MTDAGLVDPSWEAWRALLKAAYGLPLSAAERTIYTRHSDRDDPPASKVAELWVCSGRRSGKSTIAALCALYGAITFDQPLAPGERAVLPLLAKDKRQARVVFDRLEAFAARPAFAPYVVPGRARQGTVPFHSGVAVEVMAASFRSLRGHTFAGVVCDEIGYWYDVERSENPDEAILQAVVPALVEGALLVAISTPHARRGALFERMEQSFGQDGDVLALNADTLSLHPTYAPQKVARAYAADPASAASEYGEAGRVHFRNPVDGFLPAEAVHAAMVHGRRQLEPVLGVRYAAFADPSGGRVDSFTWAIGHLDSGLAVVDAVREIAAPLNPVDAISECAAMLRTYGVTHIEGDHFAGAFPAETFRQQGIVYTACRRTASDLYLELLPAILSGKVALLDSPRLLTQFVRLERRALSGGKDKVTHPPARGEHDDLANAVAGLVSLLLVPAAKKIATWSTGSEDTRRSPRAAPSAKPPTPSGDRKAREGPRRPMEGYGEPDAPGFGGDVSWGSVATPAFRSATGGDDAA